MTRYDDLRSALRADPKTWLVTGAAGFIGSHITAELLGLDQFVVGLDDLSTGHRRNLRAAEGQAADPSRFQFIEGDVADRATCERSAQGVDHVLHQAALGSVPASIAHPDAAHRANVDGFFQILNAGRKANVQSVVYASSSAVYGDDPAETKQEASIGTPLSPYAATKRINEVYAEAFYASYGTAIVGLRYFNVVGARQDPNGAYAAVVPRWLAELAERRQPRIFGDGETTRDFCPVANIVQANLLASFAPEEARGAAFNVGLGHRTSLNELFTLLRDGMASRGFDCSNIEPLYEPFRLGDIRHSQANTNTARQILGFEPTQSLAAGLAVALDAAARGRHIPTPV